MFQQGKNIAHAGIIIRNERGYVINGLTKRFPARSALTAEALAVREAFFLATICLPDKVIVETDCSMLVQAYRKEIKLGEITSILQDLWSLSNENQNIGLTWTCREGNQVAHHTANLESRSILPLNWVRSPPFSLQMLIVKDVTSATRSGCRSVRDGSLSVLNPDLPEEVVTP